MRQNSIKKAESVAKLIERGMSTTKACSKVGLSYLTFCKFNKSKNDNQENKIDKVVIKKSDNALIHKLNAENAALKKFIKDFL